MSKWIGETENNPEREAGRSRRADLRVGSAGSVDASSIRRDARHAPGIDVERRSLSGGHPHPRGRAAVTLTRFIFKNQKSGRG